MTAQNTAIYAGSFDPPTLGHQAVIEIAARLFDKLIVIVAANATKVTGRFPAAERVRLCQESLRHLPNVEVLNVSGELIADWAAEREIKWMVRGLRSAADLVVERETEKTNRIIDDSVQTIYIPAPLDMETVSSSLVMGLTGSRNWRRTVKKLVSPVVFQAILSRHLKLVLTECVKVLGGIGSCEIDRGQIGAVWDSIERVYTAPDRHYHDLNHIQDIFEALDRAQAPRIELLKFAAFFHDYYNGSGEADELKSANFAIDSCKFLLLDRVDNAFTVDGSFIVQPGTACTAAEVVAQLIRATARSGDNEHCNALAGFLVDADHAVLARKPDYYQEYAGQIRQEYSRYPDDQYQAGRIAFLERMLARPKIYRKPAFEHLEAAARRNMAAELEQLARPVS